MTNAEAIAPLKRILDNYIRVTNEEILKLEGETAEELEALKVAIKVLEQKGEHT